MIRGGVIISTSAALAAIGTAIVIIAKKRK